LCQHDDIKEKYLTELTLQPYAGNLLFYLIFEDFTDNVHLANRASKNATTCDYMVFISLMSTGQRHFSLRSYFDINRMMKLRDKYEEPAVITLLEHVVDKLILISE
jgi:hypothetical protein